MGVIWEDSGALTTVRASPMSMLNNKSHVPREETYRQPALPNRHNENTSDI